MVGSSDRSATTSPTASSSRPRVHQVPLLRRINGRPQACDPCRKRKVACDNTQPICDRCRKRKQSDRCVYTLSQHTSRHTHSRESDGEATTKSSPVRTSASPSYARTSPYAESEYRPLTMAEVHARNEQSFTDSPILRRARVQAEPDASTTQSPPAGNAYLGFFSYSTVFEEAKTSLSLLNGGQGVRTASDITAPIRAVSRQPTRPGDHLSNLGPVNREMCLNVLRSLPNPACKTLKPLGLFPAQLWARVATSRVLNQLEQLYGDTLTTGPRDDAKLQNMAEKICANSSRPFDNDIVDPAGFLDQVVGPDLRWESLGLLFTFRELAPDVNGSNVVPPPEDLGRTWDIWPEAGRACLKLCIELAKSFTDGNTILCFLYLRLVNIDALVFGDSSAYF